MTISLKRSASPKKLKLTAAAKAAIRKQDELAARKAAKREADAKKASDAAVTKHVAQVVEKDFTIVSNDKKHTVKISVLMIDDIVIYDDASFISLNPKAAANVSAKLDAAVSEYLGFDSLMDVTTL